MELIAVASDDGRSVSDHFSGAAYYVVLAVDEDRIVGREVRQKPKHEGRGDGKGKRAQSGKHRHIGQALSTIRDCGTVVVRSIGDNAYEGIQRQGVRPLITDLETVDQVAWAAVENRLQHHPERVTSSPGVWPMDES